jgi:superfamily II DNA or RNA helicase
MSKLTLRPFQKKAVAKAVAELEKRDRAKVIMPCGTGKTLVGLHVVKRKEPSRTLVVAPSLALVKQLLDVYSAEGELPRLLVVCSDDSTAKQAREKFDIPSVTTSVEVIASELRKRSPLMVFSTYQSTPRIADAFAGEKLPAFDLAVFDEAHHMAGAGKAFTTPLDDSLIRIRKRLFMTATPRVATQSAKDQAADEGYAFASMDDESQFGREAFYMSFQEAIAGGHLTDYRVAIFVVKESEIQSLVDNDEDAKEAAKRIALIRAMQQHDIRKVLTYHRTVRRMNWFADIGLRKTFEAFKESKQVTGSLWSGSLEGSDSASVRRSTLNHFASLNGDSRAVLNNCKVLQEGVDCPSVDAVCLIEPRTQPVDIVQIVGRAIRNSPNKKIATIILPVFMPRGVEEDVEAFIASSDFAPVWDVVSAIKSHDSRVEGWVASGGSFRSGDAKQHIEFNINLPAGIQGKFFEAIESRIVRRFHERGQLTEEIIWGWMQEYHKEHGNWPYRGPCGRIPGDSWNNINQCLRKGLRGLPYGSSLAKIRREKSGEPDTRNVMLTEELIWQWMEGFRDKQGKFPTLSSFEGTEGGRWVTINEALKGGYRGLPGGSSLLKLRKKMLGPADSDKLTEGIIFEWMREHFAEHGRWPTQRCGKSPSDVNWKTIDSRLRIGHRRLTGGSSLFKLRKKMLSESGSLLT